MTERRWLGVIFSLYIFFGLGYSLLLPAWEGPDEHAHYHLALWLARRGRYPPSTQNYETDQPRLYYWLASQPLRLLNSRDPKLVDFYLPRERYYRNIGKPVRIFNWTDENYRFIWGLQLLRWLNLGLGAVGLALVYRGARIFFPEQPSIALTATALAGLLPQFLHIAATVSNEALAFLAGAVLFWSAGLAWQGRLSGWLALLAIPAALLLPAVTKITALPAGLLLLAVLLVRLRSAARHQTVTQSRDRFRRVLGGGLAAGAILCAAAFLLAPASFKYLVGEIQWRGLSFHPQAFQLEYLWPVAAQTVWSYWGKVGWLAVGLPPPAVIFLSAAAVAGGLSSLARILLPARGRQPAPPGEASPERLASLLLWIGAGLALVIVAKNGLTTPRNQGRFLFPANGMLLSLVASGWQLLAPRRLEPFILPMTVGLLSALNLLLWFSGVIPVYYQPFLE
ncbi:MAG TPA: hypothetical protein VJ436_09590 [Anaerolineales bacterium]|nr:hypothetical protein [Anaerolineales bacterium]